MKKISDKTSLNFCRDSNLIVINFGDYQNKPVFESIEEKLRYYCLNLQNKSLAEKNLKDAQEVDKYFALIKRINSHANLYACCGIFTNYDVAAKYLEKENYSDTKIYNEKGNIAQKFADTINRLEEPEKE